MEVKSSKVNRPKRKRRWFQFSLRSLLIFTTAVAIACCWVERRLERKRKERAAVKRIEALSGCASYDYENAPAKAGTAAREPFGPAFLRRLLGDDFFGEVTRIGFLGGINDEQLQNVVLFAQLEELYLNTSEVTDSGLASLKPLSDLRVLFLGQTKITNEGLSNLASFTQLQRLELIDDFQITDAGIANLKSLSQLRILNLQGIQINDAGLVHLGGMARLEELDLSRTHISDAGIASLKRLKQLRSLYFYNSKITRAGLEELKNVLPNCQVFY